MRVLSNRHPLILGHHLVMVANALPIADVNKDAVAKASAKP